jgi:hypothetical protein
MQRKHSGRMPKRLFASVRWTETAPWNSRLERDRQATVDDQGVPGHVGTLIPR